MDRASSIKFGCLLLALSAYGCAGEYEVRVVVDPPTLDDAARQIEVAVIPNCAAQPPTGPVFGNPIVRFAPDEAPPALGEIPAGSHGLFARLVDVNCRVIAAGCEDIDVDGGGGTLRVAVVPTTGPACSVGESCAGGVCANREVDAGDARVPLDAEDDAGLDAEMVDAPNMDVADVVDVIDVVDVSDAADVPDAPDAGGECNSCPGGQPILPGAVGLGVCTRAAFECSPVPRIVRVTNLGDSGEGSLREAMATTGGAIIVFDVSGVIDLDAVADGESCQIVAGQTAPGPVVVRGTLRWEGMQNVLVQHLTLAGENTVSDYALNVERSRNVVVDHVTAGYAQSNALRMLDNEDVTIMNSMVSATIGDRACSVHFGDGTVGWTRNVFAFCRTSSPTLYGSGWIANNVVYGSDYRSVTLSSRAELTPIIATVVDNAFITSFEVGPSSVMPIRGDPTDWNAASQVHTQGNRWDAQPAATQAELMVDVPGANQSASALHSPACYEPLSPDPNALNSLVSHVVAHAGARPTERTVLGAWTVARIQARDGVGTPTLADTPGYPVLPLVVEPNVIPVDPYGDADMDGYLNIEEWLLQLAADVEGN